ncbi:MAG: polysaccharide deacetylase family protein [Pseudomonadota bacterium]
MRKVTVRRLNVCSAAFQLAITCVAALAAISAQSSTALSAPAADATACNRPGALGVSRIIEIDTANGPHFGKVQYNKTGPSILKDGEVVLTFDDGPLRRYTKQVLKALAAHCTKATFFAVGRMAVADADMLRKVADAGHTVGHHTWSHKNQFRRSFPRAVAEFELGVSAVSAAIGRPTAPFFRFPYLADPRAMRAYVAQRGYGIFSIDIDSYDFRTRSGSRMRRNVMSQLKRRRKGIILFHDIQASTARGIDALLGQLKSNGFRVVHIVAKAPAQTLPEYDKEAQVLLEKRRYTSRARPIKTSFQFNGAVAPQPPGNPVARTRFEATSSGQSRSTTGVSTSARQPRANATSNNAPAGNATPAWKQRALGLSGLRD